MFLCQQLHSYKLQTDINNDVLKRPQITALFDNTRTVKFKAQPTNAFFATVNQMFYGSSQLPTTAEHFFVVWTVHNSLITRYSAVVGSWGRGGVAEHLIDGSEKHICRLSFEFSSLHIIERRSKAKEIIVTEENQILIDHSSNGGSLRQMETMQMNMTWLKAQLGGGRPVG